MTANQIILNHHEIEQRLPHSGNMSLLHEVIQADDNSLMALANSHLEIDNPLRLDGKIATVNGIEYAAQAMALHVSLLSDMHSDTAQTGYLATVRNIEIKVPQLPEKNVPLVIKVERLMANENGFTYHFHISCEQQFLISGKITVFLTQT